MALLTLPEDYGETEKKIVEELLIKVNQGATKFGNAKGVSCGSGTFPLFSFLQANNTHLTPQSI